MDAIGHDAVVSARRRRRWPRRLLLSLLALPLLPAAPILALRAIDPPVSAYMLAERARMWTGVEDWRALRHQWVDWSDIAPAMRLAVVAAEDQKFPQHMGFDIDSLMDAIGEYREGGRLRGASTISQQTARNLFLWGGRSFVRKALEGWLTLWLELLLPKQRILEIHLNIAEMGHGVWGVGAAAREFFDKPASALTTAEASLLAAVLPSPKRYSAAQPSGYVRGRAEWIRGQMRNLGDGYLVGL